MVILQKSEKRKDHSNRVKIALKTSENHSKASENHSEESENHSKRVTFTFWGSSLRDSSKQKTFQSNLSLTQPILTSKMCWSSANTIATIVWFLNNIKQKARIISVVQMHLISKPNPWFISSSVRFQLVVIV